MAAENFRHDPAIDRLNTMRESAHMFFKWNRRTVTTTLVGFVVVPVALYYSLAVTQDRWKWTGKRKGESLTEN
ncbi:hypothetical protein BKA70DRAFT_1416897 [Coprinopsis sp. MPI-PUGE-AT-0042]|nr:hypothetical protein BKA70DRAFT_1416897 [Coprinopsis sp. MPI-PUGE-AT-0042]